MSCHIAIPCLEPSRDDSRPMNFSNPENVPLYDQDNQIYVSFINLILFFSILTMSVSLQPTLRGICENENATEVPIKFSPNCGARTRYFWDESRLRPGPSHRRPARAAVTSAAPQANRTGTAVVCFSFSMAKLELTSDMRTVRISLRYTLS